MTESCDRTHPVPFAISCQLEACPRSPYTHSHGGNRTGRWDPQGHLTVSLPWRPLAYFLTPHEVWWYFVKCHIKRRKVGTKQKSASWGFSSVIGGVFLYLVSFGKLWLFQTCFVKRLRVFQSPLYPAATSPVIGPALKLRDSWNNSPG